MKVAIDISPTIGNVAGRREGVYTKTGVGHYTYELVRALLEIDERNEYRLIALKLRGSPKPFGEPANVTYRFVRPLPARMYVPLLRRLKVPVPVDLFAGASDVFVFPNYVRYPLWATKRSIVFVYDLSFLRFPQFTADKARKYLAENVPPSIEKADRVVTISEHSRRELIQEFGLPEANVAVARPGVDPARFRPQPERRVADVRRRYGLPQKYVLYVGTIEPRKNISGLLAAFRRLPRQLRAEYPLVVAGGRGWREGEIVREIDRLQARGEAVSTGYVVDDDLASIYSGASLFVFPSFYEGWGMPVVEAMACGVPVVTSTASSLSEAAGDAAITVAPEDDEALAREIERIVEDGELGREMVERGLAHSSRFSWSQSAERLLALLDELADGR